jgi:uncharacterized protein
MPNEQTLIIVGASARAAAFSALRAGLRPWCVDLFADADLQARCPTKTIAAADYPLGLQAIIRTAPPGPWMYTGGLENHPRLVERIAAERELWGNNRVILEQVRSPQRLADLFRVSDIACPSIAMHPTELDPGKRWLVKSLSGAGGSGIRWWNGETDLPGKRFYYQEFVEGRSYSAVFNGDSDGAKLVCVTAQLVGEPWLHAGPFQYCGSIGPVSVDAGAELCLKRIGNVLAQSGVRGLYGVDFIQRDSEVIPIEVNPRYTASVEVIEYATGQSALALHRRVFDAAELNPVVNRPLSGFIAKAIMFARQSFRFPSDGPWQETITRAVGVEALSAFADIPAPGTPIERGQPVLSFFVTAHSLEDVDRILKRRASELEQVLWAGPNHSVDF